jgi:branched-chain amino acid transport system ATP-binding protein
MALLEIRGVTRRFGGIVAIDDVSLDVEAGQIVGLIGPNGAGKTTLFNVITRLYKPDSGSLVFAGKSLLRTPPHRVVRRGIARTFQNVELFRTMTVLDNVLVGAHTRAKPFRDASIEARAQEVLDYVGIAAVAERPAAGLPFGTLKRVELARALIAEPKLLLLDEPAAGIDFKDQVRFYDLLARLNAETGVTVVLVSHELNMVSKHAHHVLCLKDGRIQCQGPPISITPEVLAATFGHEHGLYAHEHHHHHQPTGNK